MKTIPLLLLAALAMPVSAEFSTWTSKDGRKAELELVRVTDAGGEKAGEFRMKNGRAVTIKATNLSEEDAKRLADFKPAADPAAAEAAEKSVFDDVLDGNLVKLDGKSVKKFTPESKPTKHYIFYYTASWCGPCQAYTPTLVKFYNDNKEGNNSFEIVLITSDREEADMDDYMKKKEMPWPALKMSKAQAFKKKFEHGVTGIPSVITCTLDGEIVSRTEDPAELAKIVKP